MIAAIDPSVIAHASSMNFPLFATSFNPSRKLNDPAAEYAVNSPKDNPAAATGFKEGQFFLSISQHAKPCTYKAG